MNGCAVNVLPNAAVIAVSDLLSADNSLTRSSDAFSLAPGRRFGQSAREAPVNRGHRCGYCTSRAFLNRRLWTLFLITGSTSVPEPTAVLEAAGTGIAEAWHEATPAQQGLL